MGRSNKKIDHPYNNEWGRKPYVSDNYHAMMRTPTNFGVWKGRVEKHSMFEKPYMKDHDYFEMQQLHPSMWDIPYRPPEFDFDIDPTGEVNPCAGDVTVRGLIDGIAAPYLEVDFGSEHEVTMQNGVGDLIFLGSATALKGSISVKDDVIMYTAPSPQKGCEENLADLTDNILFGDQCGRTTNVIFTFSSASLDYDWVPIEYWHRTSATELTLQLYIPSDVANKDVMNWCGSYHPSAPLTTCVYCEEIGDQFFVYSNQHNSDYAYSGDDTYGCVPPGSPSPPVYKVLMWKAIYEWRCI